MAVPEASVYEAHGPEATESKVRSSGEFPVMKPVPESARMQRSAEDQFWLRVLAADARHHPRAGHLVYDVGHETRPLGRERRSLVGVSMRAVTKTNEPEPPCGRSCKRIQGSLEDAIQLFTIHATHSCRIRTKEYCVPRTASLRSESSSACRSQVPSPHSVRNDRRNTHH